MFRGSALLPDVPELRADERTDPPVNKENANFCDYFRPTNAYRIGSRERQAGAKAKLDVLFGGEGLAGEEAKSADSGAVDPADDKQAEAKRRLDDLFGP
ncbi:MAG: hypothetical protein J4F38_14110 [Pseudomonadales bacterium]|nr:hypothetical protein [Pseudomonadales bacterium]